MNNSSKHSSLIRIMLTVAGAMTLLFVPGCGEQSTTPQSSVTSTTTTAKGNEVAALQKRGKFVSSTAPATAVIGMIWTNTANGREYIFDGSDWVPHDKTADDYYKSKVSAKTLNMTQDEVCLDGDPDCTGSGAHGPATTSNPLNGHAAFDCKVCHKVGGRLVFSKTTNPTAYATGYPTPTFDATAKTCSNIACHTVPTGTFSYYFPDGNGDPQLYTVTYGGGAPRDTPSWYATGAVGCSACHDDPPRTGSTGPNVWHSGYHGGQGPTGAYNQCQFCHPDASSPSNGIGDTITNATLHANGTVNVQATFKTACFNCH